MIAQERATISRPRGPGSLLSSWRSQDNKKTQRVWKFLKECRGVGAAARKGLTPGAAQDFIPHKADPTPAIHTKHPQLTDSCTSLPRYSQRSGPRAVSHPCPHTCTCQSAGPLREGSNQPRGPECPRSCHIPQGSGLGEGQGPRRAEGCSLYLFDLRGQSLSNPPCFPGPGLGICGSGID